MSSSVHPDVVELRQVFRGLGCEFSTEVPEAENSEYGAFVAQVGCGPVQFRAGKVTPTKVGVFMSASPRFWARLAARAQWRWRPALSAGLG